MELYNISKIYTTSRIFLRHYDDFSVESDWHCHATAHGKNVCDRIGTSVKSNGRRESLREVSSNYILTTHLYEWVTKYFKNTVSFFSSKDEYLKIMHELKQTHDSVKTVLGTQSFHYIKLLADTKKFELKQFSVS